MKSARPRRGAISTAPDSVTISACDVVLAQIAAENVGIGRGDALAAQRRDAFVLGAVWHRDRQAALAEVEHHELLEQRSDAARLKRQALFLDDVQADDAEVADVLLHQVGNVVVAHEQHVERHVLAVAHELILAAAVLEAAADQQVERVVREPPGLLQGDLETGGFVHGASS